MMSNNISVGGDVDVDVDQRGTGCSSTSESGTTGDPDDVPEVHQEPLGPNQEPHPRSSPNFPELPVGGAGRADSAPLRLFPASSGDGRLSRLAEVKFSGDLAKSVCVNEGRERLIAVLTHVDRSLVAQASVGGGGSGEVGR